MNTIERRRSPVYRQLEAYEESWRQDHQEAMACRDWEDAIVVGNNIYRMIVELESAWRNQVFRGAISFTEDDDVDQRKRYADWLNTTDEFLKDILPGLERKFGSVEGASTLQKHRESVVQALQAWEVPKLSKTVGFREMTLSLEDVAHLERVVNDAKANPPAMPMRSITKWDDSL